MPILKNKLQVSLNKLNFGCLFIEDGIIYIVTDEEKWLPNISCVIFQCAPSDVDFKGRVRGFEPQKQVTRVKITNNVEIEEF